ncbi:MAG TPA: TlyA family RNA methyltransferase [Chroococcales cyanobacterium]|jgi:23S rRNA (cytidine1920-2'-O)/16S rRNA (cytidine1409-2'-O)-methyltransferase
MSKIRLDVALVARGLFPSREQALRAILAGEVKVNENVILKAGQQVDPEKDLFLVEGKDRFASRGGLKIEKGLETFGVSAEGRVVLDVGASTGGFTDCLLKAGARQVFAIDVGYGQLAWELRNDSRVVVLERTNIRYLSPEKIALSIEGAHFPTLAVIDVSFISLAKVLPSVERLLSAPGEVVALVKPQFEAGRGKVGKKGVVRDPDVHLAVLEAVHDFARGSGWSVVAATHSPLTGPEGNIEFLVHLRKSSEVEKIDFAGVVEEAHRELHGKTDRHRL